MKPLIACLCIVAMMQPSGAALAQAQALVRLAAKKWL